VVGASSTKPTTCRPYCKLTDLIWRRGLHDCDVLVVPRLYQFHSPEQLPDHIGAIP